MTKNLACADHVVSVGMDVTVSGTLPPAGGAVPQRLGHRLISSDETAKGKV